MSGPTIVYNWNEYKVEDIARALHASMKGFGTDEDAIINILTKYSLEQRCEIAEQFKILFGEDLIDEIKSEIGGNFEKVCVAMLIPTVVFQARELNRAVKGVGTDESTLVEMLCTKSNEEISNIKEAYQTEFETTLEEDLISDTGGNFEKLLVSLVQGGRDDYDCARVEEDAQKLLDAGESMCGTDEPVINSILCLRSTDHLNEVFVKYEDISEGTSLEDAIKSETSGTLEQGFLSIIEFTKNKLQYFANRLKKAMEGAGTDEADLVRVIVTRSEIDLSDIKEEFQTLFGKTLSESLDEECGGDFVKVLQGLVKGNRDE